MTNQECSGEIIPNVSFIVCVTRNSFGAYVMDIEEKFAFLWVFVNGLVLTVLSFVEFQYENVVQGLIGGQLLTFVGWAFFAEVSRRYKVVRR